MKISMWHLYERLEAFSPAANIQDGSCVMENIRILFSDEQVLFPDYAYLVRVTPAFGWGMEQSIVLIINQKDILILHHASFYELLNELMNIFDEFRQLEERLTAACQSEQPYRKLLEVIESYYHRPMLIINNNLRILAMTDSVTYIDLWENVYVNGHMPEGFLTVFDNSENNRKFFSDKHPFLMNPVNKIASQIYRKLMVVPFSIRHFAVGKLLINWFEDEVSRGALLMGEILADFLAQAALRLYGQNPHSLDNYLVHSIKENDYSAEEEQVFYYTNGWEKSDYFRLYVMQEKNAQLKEAELRWYCGLFELSIENVFVFSMDQSIVLLSSSDREIHTKIISTFRNSLQKFIFRCGSSLPFQGLEHLSVFYRQALAASEYAKRQDILFSGFEDVCWQVMTKEIKKEFCWQPWIPRELIRLQQYDQKNGTEYFKTLHTFLTFQKSLVKTAESLHIHESSLKYRIKKLEALINFQKSRDHNRYHHYLLFCMDLMTETEDEP